MVCAEGCQSTLGYSQASNAVKPEIRLAPTEIFIQVLDVSMTVPFVRSVVFYIIDDTGKRRVDIDTIRALAVPIKSVPNLYDSQPTPLQRIETLENGMRRLQQLCQAQQAQIR